MRLTFLTFFLIVCALLLQSTLFSILSIGGVKPDLSLIVLIFISYKRGNMAGQFTGFSAGLIEDFLGLTPLGFHSLVKTLIGFLYGYIKGRVVIDIIVIPVLFVTIGTIIKLFLCWIVSLIFSIQAVYVSFFHLNTIIEIIYNAVLTPFVFSLLNLFKSFKTGET
ncbi:MAG: rod shape-determining protein MreD [Spirochaetales bacterium]|nr:rod shape-determining protein MreD [Spirochaetales bacterium]